MHSSEIENLFYERLIKLRTQKGISARDMSLSLGQSEGYINQIENRRKFPSMSGFFYICEFLNVSPSEFFDNENNNPYKEKEILSSLNYLNDEEINHIIAIIKDYERLKRSKEDK